LLVLRKKGNVAKRPLVCFADPEHPGTTLEAYALGGWLAVLRAARIATGLPLRVRAKAPLRGMLKGTATFLTVPPFFKMGRTSRKRSQACWLCRPKALTSS